MQELGSDVSSKSNDDYLIFKTICHKKESEKLYYYIDSKKFHCYSNCGNLSVYDLIIKVKECSFKEAFDYLLNFTKGYSKPITGFNLFGYSSKSLDDIEVPELEEIDKPFLYNMYSKKEIKEWSNEGISCDVQQKFKIRYDIKNNRAIIPVFQNNKCIGIRVRHFDILDAQRKGKYVPLFYGDKCYNFPTGNVLYGWDISKENIKKYRICILFEGEKSVLKYHELYNGNNLSLCIFGSNLSMVQKKMILSLGVEEIILCYDKEFETYGDDECIEYEKKLVKQFKGLENECKCSYTIDKDGLLNKKDAPVDVSKKVFEKLIQNRTFIN